MILPHTWPNPAEPGAPAQPLADAWHWLRWPRTGALEAARWSPDAWCWVTSYQARFATPEEMAHMHYLGPANPPNG